MYSNTGTKVGLCSETCVSADGAAAVETLRAELAQDKEQSRMSSVAVKKAADELEAGQAVQRQCEDRIATMAHELKEATVRCEFLERDNKTKAADLDKALQEAREA